MDKTEKRRTAGRPSQRRLVQLYAALLYNANLKGFVEGNLYTGNTKALCVPGLNCYSCPGAVGACPLGSLQNALASSGHTAGWYVFGILLLFGITLGRTICGWLCPLGLLQELLHKIPSLKIPKGRITRALTILKYAVLAVFVTALPLAFGLAENEPFPAFCKFICPAGTSEGAFSLLANPKNGSMMSMLGVVFTRKFVILVVIAAACILCYRSFCRFLCPLGALYSLFNRFALVGVRVDEDRCTGCGACVRSCEMDVLRVGDRECISCGRCMNSCAAGAISLKCGSMTLRQGRGRAADEQQAQKKGRSYPALAVRAAALLVLAFALIWFNVLDQSGKAPAAVTGSGVGEMLEDFTCTLSDGSTFHLSDCRGKTVIINQWATYCAPCVTELPVFEKIQEEHPEIVILACHNWLETKPTADEYVKEKGWSDWKIRFTVDTPDMNIVNKIGGNNTMPRTVVLDQEGRVVYNEQKSVTYEMLSQLLELAS